MALSWGHAKVDLASFLERVDSFEHILSLCHTTEICAWRIAELERAMQWATYLEQVVAPIEGLADARILDDALRRRPFTGAQPRALCTANVVARARSVLLSVLASSSFLARNAALLPWLLQQYLQPKLVTPSAHDPEMAGQQQRDAFREQMLGGVCARARWQALGSLLSEMSHALGHAGLRRGAAGTPVPLPAPRFAALLQALGSFGARDARCLELVCHMLLPRQANRADDRDGGQGERGAGEGEAALESLVDGHVQRVLVEAAPGASLLRLPPGLLLELCARHRCMALAIAAHAQSACTALDVSGGAAAPDAYAARLLLSQIAFFL
eukprot:g6665.t1